MAQLTFTRFLLKRQDSSTAPNHSLLKPALRRLDTKSLHGMYRLVTRRRPSPRNIKVDNTGFSHTTGRERISLRFKETLKRRFTALHSPADTDTLWVHAVRVRARPGGDAKELVSLLRPVPYQTIESDYGDKRHISWKNVQFIHDWGAHPTLGPKRRLKVQSRGYRGYKDLIGKYLINLGEWKRYHDYGGGVFWRPCSAC
ncbi:MAG: hypothetical protein R6V83_10405 [Candidatus Thorarchaeota archaeon]